MKKVLKILGFLVLGIVVLVAVFLSYVAFASFPNYDVKEPAVNVEVTPERIAEGQRIAVMMCKNCHLSSETGKFTGMQLMDVPEMFGKLYSRNITNHETDGIGSWTDAQLVYFLRTGIKPDGSLAAVMPTLNRYSDEDLYSVVAFLRSDHPWVEATPGNQPDHEPSLFAKGLMHFVFRPTPYPEQEIPVPDPNDLAAYGEYLVTGKWDCYGCHSADYTKNDLVNPENSPGFLGGGSEFMDMNGNAIYSANITFHPENGIGNWSEEDLSRALRTGITPEGHALRYPMIPFPDFDDQEIKAIYTYLQSVPKLDNQVDRQRNLASN